MYKNNSFEMVTFFKFCLPFVKSIFFLRLLNRIKKCNVMIITKFSSEV